MTWNFVFLYVTQFFFGAGEAGCFPEHHPRLLNLAAPERTRPCAGHHLAERALGRRLYPDSRRRALSVHGSGGRLLPPSAPGRRLGRRVSPLVPRRPARQRKVNQAELDLLKIQRAARPDTARSPGVNSLLPKPYGCCAAQYFALSFPWYFLITWAPTFIDERFHVDVTRSTMLKVLPLFMGGLGSFFSRPDFGPAHALDGQYPHHPQDPGLQRLRGRQRLPRCSQATA